MTFHFSRSKKFWQLKLGISCGKNKPANLSRAHGFLACSFVEAEADKQNPEDAASRSAAFVWMGAILIILAAFSAYVAYATRWWIAPDALDALFF